VLTGVTDPATLLAASPMHRPDLLAPDAGGLLRPHPAVRSADRSWRCGGWSAELRSDGGLVLRGSPGNDAGADDGLDGLRALCVAHWARHPDGAPVPRIDAPDDAARRALTAWRLTEH
jgi:hypothetical protein